MDSYTKNQSRYLQIIFAQFCIIVGLVMYIAFPQIEKVSSAISETVGYSVEQVINLINYISSEPTLLDVDETSLLATDTTLSVMKETKELMDLSVMNTVNLTQSNDNVNDAFLKLLSDNTIIDQSIDFSKNEIIGQMMIGETFVPTVVLNEHYKVHYGDSIGYVPLSAVTLDYQNEYAIIEKDIPVYSLNEYKNFYTMDYDDPNLEVIVKDKYTFDSEFVRALLEHRAPALVGIEDAVMNTYYETGLSPFLQLAAMILESGNGKSDLAVYKNNITGMNAYAVYDEQGNMIKSVFENAYTYPSIADSAADYGQRIINNYVNKGLTTVDSIGNIYCPTGENSWSNKVKPLINELKGIASSIQL